MKRKTKNMGATQSSAPSRSLSPATGLSDCDQPKDVHQHAAGHGGGQGGRGGMKRKAKIMGATQSSASSQMMSSTKEMSDLSTVPLEILEEILLNVPPDQVVCICRLVCHQWKEVADCAYLWRERSRRERYRPCDSFRIPADWRLFYFLCKKRRNLLKNPRAEHQFQGWKILEDYGDQWVVEKVLAPHPDKTVQKNFVTSFGLNRKEQLIDLDKEGYNPSFMDHFQPDIKICDWYASREGCGCQYHINVELLDQTGRPVRTFAPSIVYLQNWSTGHWRPMTHVFQNYGPGVRYIRFTHGGKDTVFWKGWYGVRLTDSSVEVCPAVDI